MFACMHVFVDVYMYLVMYVCVDLSMFLCIFALSKMFLGNKKIGNTSFDVFWTTNFKPFPRREILKERTRSDSICGGCLRKRTKILFHIMY